MSKADIENNLILQYQRGGRGAAEALEKLLSMEERFLRYVAIKVAPGPEPDEDLVQEGRMAMVKAASTFDVTRGVLFKTHSRWVVENAMVKAHREGSLIYVPRKRRQAQRHMAYLQSQGKTDAEIQDFLSLTCENFQIAKSIPVMTLTVDKPREDGSVDSDVAADTESETMDDRIDRDFVNAAVSAVLSRESERNSALFRDWLSESAEGSDLAGRYGLTRSRMNQLLADIRERVGATARQLLEVQV